MPSSTLTTRRRLLGGLSALVLGAGCNTQTQPTTSGTQSQTATNPPTSGQPTTTTQRPIDTALSGPWPTVGRDPANTATTDAAGPTAPISTRWTEHVGTAGELHPAVGADGSYLASQRGTLVALDEAGNDRWRRSFDDEAVMSPLVTAERVVVGSYSGRLMAFTHDGTEAWSVDLSRGLFAPHASDGTVLAAGDDTVVVAHQTAGLLAFELDDGTRRWSAPYESRIHRPVVVDDTVIATTDPNEGDGAVVAHTLADGSERWRATVPQGASVAPTVTPDAVYTGTHRGLVLAFDRDGGERWRASVDDWVSAPPAVAADGVWVSTLDGRLVGFERDGARRVTHEIELTSPVAADEVLYGGSKDSVVAFDVSAGGVRWQTDIDGRLRTPVQVGGSRLYAGANQGDAYAIDTDDGDLDWQFVDRPPTSPAPVVGDHALYVRNTNGAVEGVVIESGKSLWRPGLSGSAVGPPTLLAGGVVAGLDTGHLTATGHLEYGDPPDDPLQVTPRPSQTETPIHIDLPEATRHWETQFDGTPTAGVGVGSGSVYVPLGSNVARVDASTGAVDWEASVETAVTTVPAVADDRVLVAGPDGLSSLETATGSTDWHVSVSAGIRTSPTVRNGIVVAGGDDETVRGHTLDDGSERWRVETDGPVVSSPAVTDDRVFVGSDDGTVRALALDDGSEHWRVETDGAVRSSPAVADGTVYVGSRDRHLYALAAADGGQEWRYELDGWVDGAPAVGHGAVFVTDQSGACYCLAARADG